VALETLAPGVYSQLRVLTGLRRTRSEMVTATFTARFGGGVLDSASPGCGIPSLFVECLGADVAGAGP
jgi:hypothetical protein